MKMTKRDIMDIVLVLVGFWHLPQFFRNLGMTGWVIFMPEMSERLATAFYSSLLVQCINTVCGAILICVCFFFRKPVLNLIFLKEPEKEIGDFSGLAPLATYSFWIRLFGIFGLFDNIVSLVAKSGMDFGLARAGSMAHTYRFQSLVMGLVGIILSMMLIWKAEWFASKLGNERRPTPP